MTKRRTSERLANIRKKAKAEENKKKEEVLNEEAVEEEDQSVEDEEPFPLKQLNLDMINFVLEKLSLKESMTLMSTTKSMMSFYELKAKFKIPFEFLELRVELRKNGKVSLFQHNGGDYTIFPYHLSKILQKRDTFRRVLQHLPFRFFLYCLSIDEWFTPACGRALKERLDLLKIELIQNVHLDSNVSSQDCEILEQSLANVVIGQVALIGRADTTLMAFPFIRKHCLMIGNARGSLLEHITVIENTKLWFRMDENVSNTELEAAVEMVIEKWSRTPCALEQWKLHLTPRRDMKTYEVLKTALESRRPIDFHSSCPIPTRRPLVFRRAQPNNEMNQYYIAREDNTLVYIYFDESDLVFEVVPLVDGPPALVM